MLKNGSWKIDYVKDGVKRTFTVGQVSCRAAESISVILESLLESHEFRLDPAPSVMERVGGLSDRLRKSFERHGLLPDVKPRTFFTARQFCDEWLESRRLAVKAATMCRYSQALYHFCKFAGVDVSVSSFSRSDVERFHTHLNGKFSPTTIHHNFRVLRQVFSDGVRRERLVSNPFDGYRAGSRVNVESREYISTGRFQQLLSKISDVEVCAYLAFARYAGLRPGEINHLRFSDFQVDKFRVCWQGKTGERFVPYFRVLRPFVDALRLVRDDDEFFGGDDSYWHQRVRYVSELTGLELWPKFFVNMRSSCISDWNGRLSEFTMTSIFGNSQSVRNAHYIQPRGYEIAHILELESAHTPCE